MLGGESGRVAAGERGYWTRWQAGGWPVGECRPQAVTPDAVRYTLAHATGGHRRVRHSAEKVSSAALGSLDCPPALSSLPRRTRYRRRGLCSAPRSAHSSPEMCTCGVEGSVRKKHSRAWQLWAATAGQCGL